MNKKEITKAHILAFQMFNTDGGKKIIEYLEANYFYDDTTFVSGDVNQTIYNEGQRSIVNIIKYIRDNCFEIIKEKENPMIGELENE